MGDWCATYLRAQVRDVGGVHAGVVTAVRQNGLVLLLEPPLPKRTPVSIGIVPDPGKDPIWVRGTVAELVPARDEALLGKPLVLTEVHLDEMPKEVTVLVDREMAAAWRARRVVIVDDDLMQLRLLQLIMPRLGYDPICVSTPIGAMHVIAEVKPRLVLLDLAMPELDGATLCKMLRNNPATKDTAILFLSARSREEIERAVAEAGATGYIEKGADVNSIIAEIHRHVRAAPT
jgi:CheY-like chemotaxis protein